MIFPEQDLIKQAREKGAARRSRHKHIVPPRDIMDCWSWMTRLAAGSTTMPRSFEDDLPQEDLANQAEINDWNNSINFFAISKL